MSDASAAESVHSTQVVNCRATSFRHNPPSEVICPHANFKASEHDIGLGLTRGQECRIEYRIGFKYYDGHGFAMFFTRCKDLGDEGGRGVDSTSSAEGGNAFLSDFGLGFSGASSPSKESVSGWRFIFCFGGQRGTRLSFFSFESIAWQIELTSAKHEISRKYTTSYYHI
jgi:hypothetical protein